MKTHQEIVEAVEPELVAEINSQIQAEYGTGEKGASKAREVFAALDISKLTDAAVQSVMYHFSQDIAKELNALKGERATEMFDDITKATDQIKRSHDAR